MLLNSRIGTRLPDLCVATGLRKHFLGQFKSSLYGFPPAHLPHTHSTHILYHSHHTRHSPHIHTPHTTHMLYYMHHSPHTYTMHINHTSHTHTTHILYHTHTTPSHIPHNTHTHYTIHHTYTHYIPPAPTYLWELKGCGGWKTPRMRVLRGSGLGGNGGGRQAAQTSWPSEVGISCQGAHPQAMQLL